MLEEWLELGGVEIANHARLDAYLETVGSPLDSVGVCRCPTLTPEVLEHLPYTTPEQDGAPWYDPDVPESADFAGLMVLSVDGMDEYPVRRTVTNAVTGGGSIGPARALPRTITVTALLLGATCCAVEYGLHWLGEVLQGCTGGACDGDCLSMLTCCPPEGMAPQEVAARYRRTLRRVALTDGPRVIARTGDGCSGGDCASGADILTVEFVLTAATPWPWTDPTPVIAVPPPVDEDAACVTWCLHGGSSEPGCEGACRLAACPDPTAGCADPRCAPPPPPVPTVPETCYCLPLAVERDCYAVDLTGRPGWSVDVPVITVRAGSQDVRNLTITLYERSEGHEDMTCDQIADMERCNPHTTFMVGFVPAGGALTLDGQIGRAVVECGGVCESSPDVYGRDGAPPTWRALECATYCVCIEADVQNPPSPDALITVSVSGRGY